MALSQSPDSIEWLSAGELDVLSKKLTKAGSRVFTEAPMGLYPWEKWFVDNSKHSPKLVRQTVDMYFQLVIEPQLAQ